MPANPLPSAAVERRDWLRQRRLQRGRTHKEFAAALGKAEPTVTRWQSGNLPITDQVWTMLHLAVSKLIDTHHATQGGPPRP